MVCQAALRKIVGTNAIAAVTATDQAFAHGCVHGSAFGTVFFMDACRQHLQGLRLVAVLATAVLAFGHDTRGQMGDAHGRVGLVDVLATRAAGPVGVNAQVRRVDLDGLQLVGLGQHGHGAGAGVNAALRLCRWYALHPVATRLKAQLAVHAHALRVGCALNAQHHFLVAAQLAVGLADNFRAPAASFGVAGVKAKKVRCKQRRFIAPGAGANLDKSRPHVVRVFRDQHQL